MGSTQWHLGLSVAVSWLTFHCQDPCTQIETAVVREILAHSLQHGQHLAASCTTESHPLYGTFMAWLSQWIFEWSSEDLTLLKRAKAGELANSSVPSPSDEDIIKILTKKEQDQESVQLYTRTGTKSKGRIELPVYCCPRGSTSLESFHKQLNFFIMGK